MIKLSFLLLPIFAICGTAFAQHVEFNPSSFPQIIEALKSNYKITATESTQNNYRSYFTSDRFKQDSDAGGWNLGLNVLVDGVPLGLSAGASSDERHNFIETIRSSTIVTLSVETYYQVGQRILTPDVMREFAKWLELFFQKWGSIQASSKLAR